MVRKNVECDNKRQARLRMLSSEALRSEKFDIEQDVDDGNNFAMGDDKGAKVPEEMKVMDSYRGGGDGEPFDTEMADILPSVGSMMSDSVV